MSEKLNLSNVLKGITPKGVSGLIGLLIVIILAFSFGFLISGDSEESVSDIHTEHEHETEPTIWTCSMHPQIRLPKPGKCPICFMDLIPLETSGGDELGPRQIRLSETAKQLAQIQTVTVQKAFAETEVRMVGKIAYDERTLAYITAWIPGRLDRLYVDFTGITVKKGDHLVYMYSPELLAAQEELLQAHTAVAALGKTSSKVLKSTAKATVIAAQEKLRLFGLTNKQISEIEATGKTTDHLTIYAPIGGVVVHKKAKEGMYVSTGTQIYTIADLSRLWIYFEAYESDLPWLRYGQKVAFTSLSFPGETFEAIISFIDPVVDPKKRTVRVRAIVDNKNGALKPDMFVSGIVKSKIDNQGKVIDENLSGKWIGPMHPEIVKDGPGNCDICDMPLVKAESIGYTGKVLSKKNAPLLIPISAPLLTGKRAVVYVEIPNDDGPLFEGREVILGPRAGDFYIVKSGLNEGDLVVTNGAFKIDSELQIQAKPSMMTPSGGGTTSGHRHNQPAGNKEPKKDKQSPISVEAQKALKPVYDAYFKVQMALANDNLEEAKKNYSLIVNAIGKVDMTLFAGDTHMKWMKLSEELSDIVTNGSKAENIISARDIFYSSSKTIIDMQNSFGHSDEVNYYLTFCPMAQDNKGAFWLQTVDTVYNSFYGEKMLRCGEIKDTLSSGLVKGK